MENNEKIVALTDSELDTVVGGEFNMDAIQSFGLDLQPDSKGVPCLKDLRNGGSVASKMNFYEDGLKQMAEQRPERLAGYKFQSTNGEYISLSPEQVLSLIK